MNIRHVTLHVGTRTARGKGSAYALVLREGRRQIHGWCVLEELTPNALTLTAILAGIRKLRASPTLVHIRTASHYAAVQCVPLLDRWRAANWTRPANVPGETDPVAHADLWNMILVATERRDIRLSWTWTGQLRDFQKSLIDQEVERAARLVLAKALGDAAPPALRAEIEPPKALRVPRGGTKLQGW